MMMAARSPSPEIRILQGARQRERQFLEIGIGQPRLLAIAIGFDQTGFVGPVIQRVAQGRPQTTDIGADPA